MSAFSNAATFEDYAAYAESFDPTEYPEPDEAEQFEGSSLRDLQTAVRSLAAVGYSLATIQSLVCIAAGIPPLPPLAAVSYGKPPF